MKILITVSAIIAASLFSACSNGTEVSSTEVVEQKPSKSAVANPGKMNEFMAILDGTDGSSKKAAETFFGDDLKNSLEESTSINFVDFNLSEAKVVSVDGTCCVMEAKAGVTTRSFKLCWQGDKVESIEDLGIK